MIPKEPPSDRVLSELCRHYPGGDASAVETMVALLRIAGDLYAACNQHLSRYNLSQPRFLVLLVLHSNSGGEMACCDVAESVGVSRATMTGLIDGLERDGFVRRVDNLEDRRRVTVSLTATGRGLLEELLPDHVRRVAGVMGKMSKTDRQQLRGLLDRVRAGLPAFHAV